MAQGDAGVDDHLHEVLLRPGPWTRLERREQLPARRREARLVHEAAEVRFQQRSADVPLRHQVPDLLADGLLALPTRVVGHDAQRAARRRRASAVGGTWVALDRHPVAPMQEV